MSSERTKKWKRRLPKIGRLDARAAVLVYGVAKLDKGRGTVADRYARMVNEIRADPGAEATLIELAETASVNGVEAALALLAE